MPTKRKNDPKKLPEVTKKSNYKFTHDPNDPALQAYRDSSSLFNASERYRRDAVYDFDTYENQVNRYKGLGMIPTGDPKEIDKFMRREDYPHNLTSLEESARNKNIRPEKIFPGGEYSLTNAPFFKKPTSPVVYIPPAKAGVGQAQLNRGQQDQMPVRDIIPTTLSSLNPTAGYEKKGVTTGPGTASEWNSPFVYYDDPQTGERQKIQRGGKAWQSLPRQEGGGMLELPEYGFGSWLKDNGAGLLKGAGSLVSMIPGIGTIAGPILSTAGSVVGGIQQGNAAKDAAQTKFDQAAAASAEQERVTNLATRRGNVVNDKQVNYGATFANGGQIGQGLMQQPQITNYSKGNTHQEGVGGIPVDAKGNPSAVSKQSAVGLTEKGEVTWNGYVFSDKLKF